MSNNKKNSDEEIDLGSLFIIIGKGFTKMTAFISNVIIYVLLFFKKNILFLIIPACIGAIYGFYLEKKEGQKYESSLYVKPNFKSTIQLYENIRGYNNLIFESQTSTLSKILLISEEEARCLKKFEIKPVIKTEDVINSYEKEIDSTLFIDRNSSFSKFQRTFSPRDYRTHKISVIATKNNIFKKLTQPIISSINKNEFLSKRKTVSNEGMISKKLFLDRKLIEIDSILKINYTILKSEQSSKIDINYLMGDLNENIGINNDILKLINKKIVIKNKLFETNKYIYEGANMINLISNFQEVGSKIEIFKTKSKVYKYALLLFLISFLVVLVLSVNKLLINYKS